MKVSRCLFYLLCILLPVQIGRHFWPSFAFVSGIRIDYLSPTIYLTDIIILLIIVSWIVSYVTIPVKKIAIPRRTKAVIFLLAMFFLLNTVFALKPLVSFFKLLTLVELLLLAMYIATTKPSFEKSMLFLLIGAFYSCLIAWAQFISQSSVGGLFWLLGERTFSVSTPGIAAIIVNGKLMLRPYATFPHANVLAGFLAAVLPMLLLLPITIKHVKTARAIRFLRFPFFVFFISTIVITFSRSAWFAAFLVLSASLVFLLNKKGQLNNSRNLVAVLGAVVLFSAGIILITLSVPEFSMLVMFNPVSFDLRKQLARVSFSIIQDYPLIGTGLNNFIVSLPNYQSTASYSDLQPVHNIYLLAAAETGIVGIILFITLISNVFLSIRQQAKVRKRQVLFLSLTVILFIGLFDHYFLTIHQAFILFALIIGFSFTGKFARKKVR